MPCAVILTALSIEYLAVRHHLTNLTEKTHKGNVYEQGNFIAEGRDWNVGIVEIGAGNVGAAAEAERAIAYFEPNVILFVGVAGGIKDVDLGDVVASTKIYNYESGKAEEIFKPRPEVGISTHDLVQRARAEARKDDWKNRIDEPSNSPKVFVAPIAAGEKVIASTNADIYKFIRSNYGDAIAVEMEGFGLLRAAHTNQHVSAMAIRGISDLIDGKETADGKGSQEVASRHASAFAFQVLAKLDLSNENITSDKIGKNTINNTIASEPGAISVGGSTQGSIFITGNNNNVGSIPKNTPYPDDLADISGKPSIRQLIEDTLSDEDLSKLCYEHFRKVYNKFTEKQTKDQRILLLAEHVERQLEIPKLLKEIKQINPNVYAKFMSQS